MKSSEYIRGTSKEYAIYICQSRAIPLVSDGLKPVQRMALWILRNRADKIKTVALGGLLAYERLYVHGEASANKAIGFMAAPFKNNVTLIEPHGHFGSRLHPNDIGAPRYTEVKRSKAAQELLCADLDIVPLEDNYDGSNKQPKHFLPLVPMVLLNGISGIAYGWSTEILPRKLKDLIEATKNVLLDKPIKPLIPSYDRFNITVTNIGENKWELGGKLVLKGNSVQITELPPGIDIETFRKRLIAMEDKEQIRSFVDKSSDKVDIVINMPKKSIMIGEEIIDGRKYPAHKVKRRENPVETEKDAIEFFKLRERVTERIVVVDWDGQRITPYKNAEDLIVDFVKWRLGWYTKRYEHRLQRDTYEIKYWKVLKILFENGFTKRLGTFPDKEALQKDVIATVDDKIKLDKDQLERVVNLPTYRWTKDFLETVTEKIIELDGLIKDYKEILASKEKLRDIYLKELNDLKSLAYDIDLDNKK